MSSKQPPKVEVNRHAGTGRFVTERYVQQHPGKTVTEHYPRHTPTPPARKGR